MNWLDGAPNHGLLLRQEDPGFPRTVYASREDATNQSFVQIHYTTTAGSGVETDDVLADAFIWETYPTSNFGLLNKLYTGRHLESDLEKLTLIRFETPEIPAIPDPAELGDHVWLDSDGNGVQDADEPGVEDVTVNLYDCDGNMLATTTTDADGYYLFGDLDAGDYTVEFTLPDGYIFTAQNQGDDALDSDAGSTGMTECITLGLSESNLTIDAGLVEEIIEDCNECDGKMTQLTLKYHGVPGHVEIYEGGHRHHHKLLWEGDLVTGDEFTFNGIRNDGTMHPEISCWVDGDRNVKIHTSCSRPIGVGMIAGDFEVVSGYSRNGGLLCPIDGGGDDCGECDGQITRLTMQYLKDTSAYVVVYKGKDARPDKILYEGQLTQGDEFTFNGVGHHGTMGAEISFWEDGVRNVKLHTSCSRPIGAGLVAGDFMVVSGYSRHGGLLCPVEGGDPEEPGDDCGECHGKLTQLTLLYQGSQAEYIEIYEGKHQHHHKLLYEGFHSPGAEITFTGIRHDGTMHPEISCWLGDDLDVKIHTSCSRPIGPGLVAGSFEVLSGYSRHGGLLCPVEEGSGDPADSCDDGKAKALVMRYTGEGCEASVHNQPADKVQCDGDPADEVVVRIVALDKENPNDHHAKIWFEGNVALNDTFTIDAENGGDHKLKAKTFVYIFDLSGNLLQFLEFHTSCSKPLAVGNQFGSLLIEEFIPEH
ncbi:MAG: hypothetical protein GY835_16165 [bacterium]|nr:hypothetical protein [bacterium]